MQDPAARFREFIHLDRKRAAAGLTTAEMERWTQLKRAFTKRLTPDAKNRADRRESMRVPVKLKVAFETVGALRDSYMTDFSRGGVFIATETPAEIGTSITLRIRIGETGDDVEVPGVVVTQNLGPGLQSTQRGMGVRFSEMPASVRKRIDDLYEQSLREATSKQAAKGG